MARNNVPDGEAGRHTEAGLCNGGVKKATTRSILNQIQPIRNRSIEEE